jgi:hypothetical protein
MSLRQALLLGFVPLPNLLFADVVASCETQQWLISEPSHKSFFFDQTGRFFGQRRRSCETT